MKSPKTLVESASVSIPQSIRSSITEDVNIHVERSVRNSIIEATREHFERNVGYKVWWVIWSKLQE